ncbi:hypothetical protein AGMMS50293_21830 [Spirochaetia bacterium]|nr:hypothetical protein AGMMS50293_21830 [Spirochaetia bacterium]
MKNCFRFFSIALALITLCSACRSINNTRAELGIPQASVVLSFDDGPNAHGDTTARLLDILKKHHIQAMFCLLGENAEYNPELVRRIRDEGHYIINHGYSEKWARKMDDAEFRDNLLRGEAAITTALGEAPQSMPLAPQSMPLAPQSMPLAPQSKLYRPHGGFYTAGQEKIWQEAGYTMAGGSARAYDAPLTAAKKTRVIRQIVKAIEQQGGGLILLHDARDSHIRMEAELAKNPNGAFNRSWMPEAVEEIIVELTKKGYRFDGGIQAAFPQKPCLSWGWF